jgi:hypothetical protein
MRERRGHKRSSAQTPAIVRPTLH